MFHFVPSSILTKISAPVNLFSCKKRLFSCKGQGHMVKWRQQKWGSVAVKKAQEAFVIGLAVVTAVLCLLSGVPFGTPAV